MLTQIQKNSTVTVKLFTGRMKTDIPKPTLDRLVSLARLLNQLEKDVSVVSSAELEKLTGWSRDTIRRDISLLGANCSTASGYKISELKATIHKYIGSPDETIKCCIVGLGRMGEALMEYSGFANTAFKLVAGFDSNVNRTETLRSPFPLYTTTQMESVIKSERIEFAILTVPEQSAQAVAEKLVEYGITGIVNFTTAILSLPETIKIENISVLDALQKLVAQYSVLGSKK